MRRAPMTRRSASSGVVRRCRQRLAVTPTLRLHTYFLGLLVTFVAVAAVGVGYASLQTARDARQEAVKDAGFASQAAAAEVGEAMAQVRATASQLVATPGIEKTLLDPKECGLAFGGSAGFEAGHIDVLRTDGTVACSSRERVSGERPVSYQGAGWLARARKAPVFEAPVMDPATRTRALVAAAPIKGGTIAVFVTLGPLGQELAALYRGGRPIEVLIIGGADRRVIARSIRAEQSVGRSLRAAEVPAGTALISDRDLDGVPRLYRGAPVAGTDWRLFAGSDEHVALAAADTLRDRQLIIIGLGLFLTLLATLVVYRRVARPIARLEASVREVDPGEPRPILVEGPVEISHLAGSFNGLIASINEQLEKRERLERKIQQGQRMEAVGRLAGGIAHDFNNLLAAVVGYSDLLLLKTPEGDPRRAEIHEIKAAGARGAGLIKQLLAFARGQELHKEVLDVNATIEGIQPLLRQLLPPTVTIELALSDDAGAIDADRSQLEQVIVNLAINSGHAMPDGGTLQFSTGSSIVEPPGIPGDDARPCATITVSDTGVGMDAETLSCIFEPFFTTRALGEGSGLGLATVYRIVEQSGGAITADSEPGAGATFTIAIPASSALPRVPVADVEPVHAAPRQKHVLLVEDDSAVRELVKRMLELEGFDLLVAVDGDEALSISDGHAGLDLVITDSVLPGPGGLDLASLIRQRHPGIGVVIMSGHGEQEIARDARADLGAGYIAKPFTRDGLHAALISLDAAMPAHASEPATASEPNVPSSPGS